MKTSDLAILNSAEGRLRLLSALILAPVVLFLVYLGGPAYAALVALVMSTALYEWLRLVDPQAPLPDRCGIHAALILTVVLAAAGMPSLGFIVLALAGAAFYAHRSNNEPQTAFLFTLGLPYLGGSALALICLRATPDAGFATIAYLLAAVWGMDIGAYVAGRLFGGPKLAPDISPNKTWSGFFGGMILAVFLAALVLLFGHAPHVGLGLFVAVFLAGIAQAGDLFKSFFKRRAGVKDCGNIIPGHGGILDRIDGLVFAAIGLALLQAGSGSHIIW